MPYMKATGIVRRIDDLGRVVIPKEIRRTMRIREGDPLEIFTDNDGEVIFKKYSPIGELSEFAGQYAEVLFKVGGHPVVIMLSPLRGFPKRKCWNAAFHPCWRIVWIGALLSAAKEAPRFSLLKELKERRLRLLPLYPKEMSAAR